MGYVGNPNQGGFVNLPAKQDLTGASGTSLTLSHAVSQPEAISLFINNVRQEPTTAYTVSGTTVTLTGSVVASDDIYVVYNGLAIQQTVPPDNSVTDAKIAGMASSKLTGALPALDGSNLTGVGVAGITSASSSGTALNIDNSNRVTLSNTAQPSWYLKKNNGNVGSTNTIVFNDIARAAGVTLSNGVVTLPVTGVYAVSFGFLKNGGDCDVEIRLNNNSQSLIKARASSSSNHSSASGVIFQRFGAGDNLRVVVTNGTVHGANPWTYFSGYLVG